MTGRENVAKVLDAVRGAVVAIRLSMVAMNPVIL